MTKELWQLSAVDIVEGIQARLFSAESVMAAVIGRIKACNPQLNSIVDDYSSDAMIQARDSDRILEANGPIGPLHGVPVTIKSNVDVAGTPTPNGLPAFKDNIAPDDAPVVRNLRNAGAIIVGRTNDFGLNIFWIFHEVQDSY